MLIPGNKDLTYSYMKGFSSAISQAVPIRRDLRELISLNDIRIQCGIMLQERYMKFTIARLRQQECDPLYYRDDHE